MPATSPVPGSQPDEPRPLSDHEQRLLAGLEAGTTREDPALSLRMARTGTRWLDGVSSRTLNAFVQASVVLVLAVAVLPDTWVAWLITLIVVVAPLAVVVSAIRRGRL